MKKIVFVHTLPALMAQFEKLFREQLTGELKTMHMLDTFLLEGMGEGGALEKLNSNRLYNTLKSAEMTGADAIVVTCAAISKKARELRFLFSTPLFTIDDTVGEAAIACGEKLTVFASGEGSCKATVALIQAAADAAGKQVEITKVHVPQAFEALKRSDIETMDKLLLEDAKKISGVDKVVFAQASMMHLAPAVEEICGISVLTSPDLCVNNVKKALGV